MSPASVAPSHAPATSGPAPTTPSPVGTPRASAPSPDGTQAAVAQGWGSPIDGDEFNTGTAPDPARWQIYSSSGNAGQGVRTPAADTIANGVLTIAGDAEGNTGGIAANFERQKYGRWEVRMKTSSHDANYHPVVLLWPDSNASPTCAEVDFAEGTTDTSSISFFLHYACTGSTFQTLATKTLDTTQWHDYAVEWTPTAVTGYVDGVPWFRDTAHVPHESMHLTLQLDWFPNGAPTTPAQMLIDWVRVYAAAEPLDTQHLD
ncbi:glycoside hydrolase family 16 protein [Sinomonas humi]|uniref:glycoside hydrolase family 16 protein n=1 Tax=Sinomonas humi TaxID=1338436 RepID=UPI0009E0AF5B|nr:glycoside hydrolase family 16 protein [Sinomonas humi]